MTQRRTYRIHLTGRITVDDATVKSAILGFQLVPLSDDIPELTDEERFALSQDLLRQFDNEEPATTLLTWLVGGPLDGDRITKWVASDLPDAVLELDPVEVVEET